ncbi:unnamed protein product [Effrenium voratum]|nr:unnamed protein product [Effrenium voratum]
MGRGLEKSGSGLDKSGSDLARQNSSVSGISNVPAEEPEEEWETMSQLQQKITDQRLAFQEQQKQERAAARAARKAAAKKALRKKLRDPPPGQAFRRPCAMPQELGEFQRLPVQYLEPKHAAMMDRPDRCRWYSKENHPAFLIAGQVPRTFDDPVVIAWAKKKDPDCGVDIRQFLEPKPPPPRQLREVSRWKLSNASPRELDRFRPLLERAGEAALAPKTAR